MSSGSWIFTVGRVPSSPPCAVTALAMVGGGGDRPCVTVEARVSTKSTRKLCGKDSEQSVAHSRWPRVTLQRENEAKWPDETPSGPTHTHTHTHTPSRGGERTGKKKEKEEKGDKSAAQFSVLYLPTDVSVRFWGEEGLLLVHAV